MSEEYFNIEILVVTILIMLTLINIDFINVTEAQSVSIKFESQEDVPIISKVYVSQDDAKKWAIGKGASEEFVQLADLYWEYSEEHGGVNPALAYVQAAKETAYGNFGGVLDASYNNPCGLKTSQGGGDYNPNAHMKFESWHDGVKAHLDHLALYAGAEGYPKAETEDPRHFPAIYGKADSVVDLGANWAPSETYGDEILGMYNELIEGIGNYDLEVTNIY
ncbi:glucosaminidase domain-containing protein [Clostridium sp. B9]|uniref:glucosaminidase domain-containing protein n=1 Tax=Clostridium sp. B9 TaxID=3423224 RepID=UPI003D2F476A